jgi:hypothetical protein
MSDEQDQEQEQEGSGTYNPSGGVPSHPADPGYGGNDPDDDEAVDKDDDS